MVCSICLDELFDDGTFQNFTKSLKEITLIHVCGHQFHKKCLDRALVDKLRCPKCRIDIDRSSFGPLSDVLVQQQGQQDAQQGQQDDHGVQFLGVVRSMANFGHGNENGPEYNGHENGLQELHDPQNVLEHVHENGLQGHLEPQHVPDHGPENEYLALDRAVLEHQHVPPVLDGHEYEVHRVGTKMRLLCKCGTNVERFWVKWLHHEPSWEDVNQIVGQESCQEALAYWQARHLVGSTPERLVDHVDNDRAHEQPTWVLSGNKRKVLTESARPARSSAVRQLFRSSTIIPAFQPLIDDVNNALRNLQQLVHHGPEPVQLQELQRVQHEEHVDHQEHQELQHLPVQNGHQEPEVPQIVHHGPEIEIQEHEQLIEQQVHEVQEVHQNVQQGPGIEHQDGQLLIGQNARVHVRRKGNGGTKRDRRNARKRLEKILADAREQLQQPPHPFI